MIPVVVLVVAKAPVPGQAKTRLAASRVFARPGTGAFATTSTTTGITKSPARNPVPQ